MQLWRSSFLGLVPQIPKSEHFSEAIRRIVYASADERRSNEIMLHMHVVTNCMEISSFYLDYELVP
jgi:hypothetical protein